jgi:hypothetical protein
MLLRTYKGTGPGVIFLIAVVLLAVWANAFFNPQLPPAFNYETIPMPLYGLLQMGIGNNAFIGVLFSFSMVILMSYLLVHFNTTAFFINERTFLPALMYFLLTGFFPHNQLLNPVLPAAVFLVLALNRIMDGYRKPGVAYNFFDAAILISAGSLFYANLIWFGILVLIGIALLRAGSLIEIIVSLIGLVTPYFITFGIYYVLGKDLPEFISIMEQNLFVASATFGFSRLTIVALVTAGIVILVSVSYLFMVISNKKIKSRKTFSLLLWSSVLSAVLYLVMPSVSVEIMWLIAIPVSYFLTHYFVFSRKKVVPEVFFYLLVLLVVLLQISYLI